MSGLDVDIDISTVQEHEFAAVDRLIEAAYAHDYGPSEERSPMHSSRARAEQFEVWVARGDGGLLGSVTTRRAGGPSLHEDIAASELDLRLLGVSPGARRQGVGASLMRFVIAEAERQGFEAVVLKTAPNMIGAQRLYDALGFRRDPDRAGLWIGGEKVLDLFTYVYPLR